MVTALVILALAVGHGLGKLDPIWRVHKLLLTWGMIQAHNGTTRDFERTHSLVTFPIASCCSLFMLDAKERISWFRSRCPMRESRGLVTNRLKYWPEECGSR